MVRKECRSCPTSSTCRWKTATSWAKSSCTTNLIIAASETDEHLTDAEIDEILGVAPAPPA